MTLRKFQIYRYEPDGDAKPRLQTCGRTHGSERMLLDALMKCKAIDPSLSFWRSCRDDMMIQRAF
jgi:succinate dehydrogenase / fumarate reductase iron-sulfur subunit